MKELYEATEEEVNESIPELNEEESYEQELLEDPDVKDGVFELEDPRTISDGGINYEVGENHAVVTSGEETYLIEEIQDEDYVFEVIDNQTVCADDTTGRFKSPDRVRLKEQEFNQLDYEEVIETVFERSSFTNNTLDILEH